MADEHVDDHPEDRPASRVGLPLLMLVLLLGGVGLILFSLSRVFLAVSSGAAVMTALAVAAFVLLIASTLGQNHQVSGRALGVALLVGLLGVGAAGAAALQAGPREIEEYVGHLDEEELAELEEQDEDGGEEDDEDGGEEVEEIPDDALVWVAEDIVFADSPGTAEAGEVTIAIDNQGDITHDITIDELDIHVEASGGEVALETYEVEAGTYDYFCSVPGHEEPMSGEVTFE